jgi:hypothetical protein
MARTIITRRITPLMRHVMKIATAKPEVGGWHCLLFGIVVYGFTLFVAGGIGRVITV